MNSNPPLYNFRFAPEAVWLVVNTVVGAVLTSLLAVDFTSITDWKAWAIGFGVSVLRTIIGAILTAAGTGQFLGRGEQPDEHSAG